MSDQLINAVYHGNLDLVKQSLDQRVNVNEIGPKPMYYTALKFAVENNDANMVELLLNRGADPNLAFGSPQITPLFAFSRRMFRYGANVDQPDITVALLLLEHGADPNHEYSQDIFGDTALHYAVRFNWLSLIQMLLDFGADRTVRNNAGQTPYQLAIDHSYPEAANMLLNYYPAWTPATHLRRTTPEQRQQIETMMHMRQYEDTPLATMPPELMYQVFPYMTS